MKFQNLILMLICLAIVSGCSVYSPPPPRVISQVTRFNVLEPLSERRTVYIMPTREQTNDIEYAFYKERMADKLRQTGFVIMDNAEGVDYVAQFIYRVSDRVDEEVTVPVYDTIGGGEITTTRNTYDADGNYVTVQETTQLPYETVFEGNQTYTVTTFARHLHLVIYDHKKSTKENVIQAYKAEVFSQGSNRSFNAVSGCLMDAMFENFEKSGFEEIQNDSCLAQAEETK